MASKKSQHFVPKVHLKPFATDADGNAISLFNIKQSRVIHEAGIKHQCARNYFYGKDDKLETMFGQIEGQYAIGLRNAQNKQFSEGDLEWMKMFMALQHSRTEVAAAQVKEFFEKSGKVTFRGKSIPESERPPLDPRQIVIQALKQIRAVSPSMAGLAFCIFKNQTNTDFVTSDNPLVNTNRFYCQKLNETSWGAQSAGALFILPLSPRLLACLYDPGVYVVDHANGYVEITKVTDVLAFNEMQYLNAAENIYFSDPASGDRIASEFTATANRRVTELARLTEYGAIELKDGRDKLVRLKPGMDEAKFDSKYIRLEMPRPVPARWPSGLRFRAKPVAYSNGSAAGYVRQPEFFVGSRPWRLWKKG
jgi:hypothetical protein